MWRSNNNTGMSCGEKMACARNKAAHTHAHTHTRTRTRTCAATDRSANSCVLRCSSSSLALTCARNSRRFRSRSSCAHSADSRDTTCVALACGGGRGEGGGAGEWQMERCNREQKCALCHALLHSIHTSTHTTTTTTTIITITSARVSRLATASTVDSFADTRALKR